MHTSHLLKRGCWTPSLNWKDPIKYGLSVPSSVRRSVCPYVYLGFAHQFFLKSSEMLGVQLCVTQPDFWEKISIMQKQSKMAQKQGFWIFKKISLLVLFEICVKFLWFINILRKVHVWEKPSSKLKAKMALSQ